MGSKGGWVENAGFFSVIILTFFKFYFLRRRRIGRVVWGLDSIHHHICFDFLYSVFNSHRSQFLPFIFSEMKTPPTRRSALVQGGKTFPCRIACGCVSGSLSSKQNSNHGHLGCRINPVSCLTPIVWYFRLYHVTVDKHYLESTDFHHNECLYGVNIHRMLQNKPAIIYL